jgi:hypothetical protein
MCGGSAPEPPKPMATRQAARAPDAVGTSSKTLQNLVRRATMASTIYTNPNGMGAAPTRGVSLLGQ